MVGILTHEKIKQAQKEIEVKALIALIEHGNPFVKAEATKKLWNIAFPESLAEEINQETL
jgi:hypothetical protein